MKSDEDEDQDVFMIQVEDIEDVGEIVSKFDMTPNIDSSSDERRECLADSGASHNIINDTMSFEPGSERAARGSIRGADPNAALNQITSKGTLLLLGYRIKAYRADSIPKCVFAVVETTIQHPISFKWYKGDCHVKDYSKKKTWVVKPTGRLTKLPEWMFTSTARTPRSTHRNN